VGFLLHRLRRVSTALATSRGLYVRASHVISVVINISAVHYTRRLLLLLAPRQLPRILVHHSCPRRRQSLSTLAPSILCYFRHVFHLARSPISFIWRQYALPLAARYRYRTSASELCFQSMYTSYITFCFNVGYLCCLCVCVLFATQHRKICIALWYLVRGDFRPVITLNLLTVSIVIISLYTVLLTCFKA